MRDVVGILAVRIVDTAGRASLMTGKSLGIGLLAGYQRLSRVLLGPSFSGAMRPRGPARASIGGGGSPPGAWGGAPRAQARPRDNAPPTGRGSPPRNPTQRPPPPSATPRTP